MTILYFSPSMEQPHPRLVPLLEKHQIDWADFRARGRPAKGSVDLRAKRSSIVTELHESGCSWSDMFEVTGLSNGSIQRLTKAMWNPASRVRLRDNMSRVGSSGRGKSKPWATKMLKEAWASGRFDAMLSDPNSRFGKVSPRGKSFKMSSVKCSNRPGLFTVRSSYEKRAVEILDSRADVVSFEYERVLIRDKRRILPDFIVSWLDGTTTLIEVKSVWELQNPKTKAKAQARLDLARVIASERGLSFLVWTEKELGLAL